MSRLKNEVYVAADNVFTPLGTSTASMFERMLSGQSTVLQQSNPAISEHSFFASLFSPGDILTEYQDFTRFEQLLVASVSEAMARCPIIASDPKTILILSSTKGNISLLEEQEFSPELADTISLSSSAKRVSDFFGFIHDPIVISNACISGVVALITAMRLIQTGQFDQAVVCGADVISRFVFSGFESFQALCPEVCRPFDADRQGLNLGEGAATVILSSDKRYKNQVKLCSGAISNDSNHISGPSRTGEELATAIKNSLVLSGRKASEIDFISAHGTATLYNDEMESKAFGICGLQDKPVNSLKAYFGHTLGAAGLIESVVSFQSLRESLILPSLGFKKPGVSQPLNVCKYILSGNVRLGLKTASGFGGCNAALVFSY